MSIYFYVIQIKSNTSNKKNSAINAKQGQFFQHRPSHIIQKRQNARIALWFYANYHPINAVLESTHPSTQIIPTEDRGWSSRRQASVVPTTSLGPRDDKRHSSGEQKPVNIRHMRKGSEDALRMYVFFVSIFLFQHQGTP